MNEIQTNPMQRPNVARETSGQLSRWTLSPSKRALDLGLALPVMLIAAPLMAVIATAVKLTSRGPAIFRQKRVGLYGREFELLKFRSMRHAPADAGPGVTQEMDRRITPMGRWLRKTKLDELPQLINVLRGEMSLIGPRPDLRKYLARLSPELSEILLIKPGITGPASIAFRNEEKFLGAMSADRLEQYYVETLLPQKVQMDLNYFRRATCHTDLWMLVRTGTSVLFNHVQDKQQDQRTYPEGG